MLYSAGLDSASTLLSHFSEKPYLISIWGSDVMYDNIEGWNVLNNVIKNFAYENKLTNITVRSTFREFDSEKALDDTFSYELGDGWWHGIKHSLGLLGHVAPIAYQKGIKTMYIASSYSPKFDEKCASNPITDNLIQFVGCKVIHDGYQFSRQDKIRNVVEYCNNNKTYYNLHVCWKSGTGMNCNYCEKCYRTMLALIAEGEDPQKYGFSDIEDAMIKLKKNLVNYKNLQVIKDFWIEIQERMRENLSVVKKFDYWKHIKFFIKLDLENPNSIKYSFFDELRTKKGIKKKLKFILRRLHFINSTKK